MKIILIFLLLAITTNLYANCAGGVKNSKSLTVTGWTPEEAYQKLHLELPKIGVFQEVDVKSIKTLTDNNFTEKVQLRSSIKANIDMIATHHCKIDNMYAITALIPEGKINYYPERLARMHRIDPDDKEIFFKKFWTFEQARRYCGTQDYSLISIQEPNAIEVQGGRIVHVDNYLSMITYVICGSNWTARISSTKSNLNSGRYCLGIQHDGRKYGQWWGYDNCFSNWVGDVSRYMELQMLQNAIEGR